MKKTCGNLRAHLNKKLKDVYFRELFELEQEKMKLARVFVDYRIKHDLTQDDLAKQLNISQQYVSKLEEGIFSNIRDVANLLLAIGYKLEFRFVNIPEKVSKELRNKLQMV
jgi:DNA-binding XRE family transcriptional regulator